MSRDNDTWLKDLRDDSVAQHEALSELREALLRGLRCALAGRAAIDDAFVEDAVQNSLVRILDRLGQFEGRSRFLTWATSIAIRVAMSDLRRRRWKDVSLEDVVMDARFDEGPGPLVNWERQALLNEMHAVIQHELSDKQRSALLAELKGMPQEEIARHLGSNRNAVYKLTHDARKRLKRGLEAAGYRATDVHSAFTS